MAEAYWGNLTGMKDIGHECGYEGELRSCVLSALSVENPDGLRGMAVEMAVI